MNYGLIVHLVSSFFMFGVVQLRQDLISRMKINWTQELLVAILLGILKKQRISSFFDPLTKSFFEIGNARFLEDVVFEGEDKVRNVVFEEESISLP